MRRRGYMFLDAIVALGLLTAVTMLVVTVRHGTTRLTRQTDDRRAVMRGAERVLIDAAWPVSGAAATGPASVPTTGPSTVPTTTVVLPPDVVRVDLPMTAPTGWKWVSVRATVNGRTGEMVGLVQSPPARSEP